MATHPYLDHGLAILQTQLGAAPAPQSAAIEAPPFITISREVCAGATSLGQTLLPILDKSLGRDGQSWMFFDKNLLHFALSSHQLPESLAKFLPEDRVSEIKSIIGELVGLHPSLWELANTVAETIRELARSGRVVFTGRAAHLLTQSLPGGFRVRLVADREIRIRRLMALKGGDRASAAAEIDGADQARRRYVRTNFGRDIDDPHTYDLVINTSRLSPAEVARLVVDGLLGSRAIA